MNTVPYVLALDPALLARLERWLPVCPEVLDFSEHYAFRWRKRPPVRGYLQPVRQPHVIRWEDLQQIDRQKAAFDQNMRQFLAGQPCNNVLLWGARGTGKSSIVKASLHRYAAQGLRLIEVDRHDLVDVPDIVEPLYGQLEKFVLYCDDLSFEAHDPSYKALKAMLDGSVNTAPDNVLICATSNRRHLLPEFISENQDTRLIDGELHHGESVEEKISLSERFGLWLAFHPFPQEDYLDIVAHWLCTLGWPSGLDAEVKTAALAWALQRGSRSGRIAAQFAKDWVGRHAVGSL